MPEDLLELLVADPGSSPWEDPQLEDGLRQRLQFLYPVFLKVVDDMNGVLKELQMKLKLDLGWKVGHCALNGSTVLSVRSRNPNVDLAPGHF